MKITKFTIVGVVNTLLAYGVYIFFISIGAGYQIALLMDYIFGLLVGYLFNRYWTFADGQKLYFSFFKYVISYILMFFCNWMMLTIFVKSAGSDPKLTQFLLLAVIALGSFLLQKKWIFNNG